jgi:DNA-binding winged helix-turn-helix (wHTH) protein/tetratricopeptide (TPR) repeat protein
MGSGEQENYRFGEFDLDARTAELLRDGRPVKIFPRAFDLLLYLLRHRDRMVPREELLAALWPDVTVGAAVLTQTVWELRKALGDASDQSELIRNSRGRGYRFVGLVTGACDRPAEPNTTVRPTASTAPRALQRAAGSSLLPVSQAYVGRELELRRLRAAFEAALEGRGSVCLLGGESGIGKTRACEEVMAWAQEAEAHVVEGRCYEGQGGPPFWPWLQILRRLFEELPKPALRECLGAGAPDLCRFSPELAALFPEVPQPPARASDQDRFYVLDGLAALLVRVAAARPLVLLLDDLHWADTASLLLLEVLARNTTRARMLVLATYRTTGVDPAHQLSRTLAALATSSEQITLPGLSEREVARLLCSEVPNADEALAASVHQITGGNPLFVIQVARLIASEQPARAAIAMCQSALPDEVREVICKRIAHLPAECVEMLRIAAAIGQRFRFNDLCQVTGQSQDELLGLLQLGIDVRLVAEDQLGVYRFGHPLIREAVHQSLRMPERARLHQRIGTVIEAAHGSGDDGRLDELAYHFCEAAAIGGAERAVEYAERAGERAFAATAYETAAEYFEKALCALELTAQPDMMRGAALRLQRAQALRGARENPERVRELFREVAEFAKARGEAELMARAALGYAGLGPLRMRQQREAGTVDPVEITLLEQTLSLLPDGDSTWRALALGQLAQALYNTRERKRREHLSSAAVEMARRVDDPYVLAEVLLMRHGVLTAPDQLDERLGLTSEIISLTQTMELKGLELDAHAQRAFLLLQKGQLASAEADMATSVRLAEELQQPDEKGWFELFEILRMFWEGRFAEGERQSREFGARRAHRGGAAVDQGHSIRMFNAGWLQGRGAELIDPLVAISEKYPLPVVWRCSLASSFASVGRLEDARREFERLAVNDFEDLPYDHNWISCHSYLAYVCEVFGDRKRAAIVQAALRPYADRVILLGHASAYAGPVATPLARVAMVLDQWDEAERCYVQAIERNAAFGARPWTALCQFDLAVALRKRGGVRDRLRARALLGEALATASELGMRDLLDQAERLPALPHALSPSDSDRDSNENLSQA